MLAAHLEAHDPILRKVQAEEVDLVRAVWLVCGTRASTCDQLLRHLHEASGEGGAVHASQMKRSVPTPNNSVPL